MPCEHSVAPSRRGQIKLLSPGGAIVVAFRLAIPSAATMAFARPWRRVEELPPAVLHSWLDDSFTFSVVDSEVVLLAGKTFLKLTPDKCWYSNAEVPTLTLPSSDLHGAKVLPSPLIMY